MTLHPDFTTMIVKALPSELRDLLVETGPALCVAGGFCRDVMTGHEPKDIDIFSRSKAALTAALDSFDWIEHYTMKKTANAENFVSDDPERPDIQFITRVFLRDHYNAILSFDFSICQVGVYFDPDKGWVGLASEAFLEDLPNFRMRYTAPERDEDPGASLLRMVKFVSRGYKIAEADIAKIVGRFVFNLPRDSADTEEWAVDAVKTAFRRIGYAGKQEIEVGAAVAEEDEVPF
jgi:hypothetical protein